MEKREIDENPFLKILNIMEILRKEKEIFSQEQIRTITSVQTINLLQSLQLCAKNSNKMEISSSLAKNNLRMLILLEEIEEMVKIFKKKAELGRKDLMFYHCKVSDTIGEIKTMIPKVGDQPALFELAFY